MGEKNNSVLTDALQVVVGPTPHSIVAVSLLLEVGSAFFLQPALELVAVLVHGQVLAIDIGGLVVALGLQLAATRGSNPRKSGDGLALHRFGAEGLMLLGSVRHLAYW